jgi:PAS domain-containing protein
MIVNPRRTSFAGGVGAAGGRLPGYPEAELLMLTFHEITHPDDLDADMRQVERLVAEEIDRYTMSKRYFRKDGDQVWRTFRLAGPRRGTTAGAPLTASRGSAATSSRSSCPTPHPCRPPGSPRR